MALCLSFGGWILLVPFSQAKVLKSLLEYTLFHFLAEEVVMRRITYPQYKQHHLIHQAFTQQVLDIQHQFNNSSLDIDGPMISSMYQWYLGFFFFLYSAHNPTGRFPALPIQRCSACLWEGLQRL